MMRRSPFLPLLYALPFLVVAAFWPSLAFAQGIEGILKRVGFNLTGIPDFLAMGAYVAGIVFTITGLTKAKAFAEQSAMGPAVRFYEVWTRFLAAGLFFVLPWALQAAINTLGLNGANFDSTVTGPAAGAGLDGMMIRLIKAIYGPMKFLVPTVCYIVGMCYGLVGINRLMKNPADGPRGPVGRGTIMTFVTAAILMSIGSALDSSEMTLFGANTTNVHMVLSYSSMAPGALTKMNAAIAAVMMFASVLGWIAFARGWLILRAIADGQQGHISSGITHIVGGVLATNLPAVLSAVQVTLGLSLINA
ncbi:MAG: hypothetical protein M3O22_00040 [Pseudomonadota bacterium]|nr:hypothetical protein [Pseudomonadota bacterium]